LYYRRLKRLADADIVLAQRFVKITQSAPALVQPAAGNRAARDLSHRLA